MVGQAAASRAWNRAGGLGERESTSWVGVGMAGLTATAKGAGARAATAGGVGAVLADATAKGAGARAATAGADEAGFAATAKGAGSRSATAGGVGAVFADATAKGAGARSATAGGVGAVFADATAKGARSATAGTVGAAFEATAKGARSSTAGATAGVCAAGLAPEPVVVGAGWLTPAAGVVVAAAQTVLQEVLGMDMRRVPLIFWLGQK